MNRELKLFELTLLVLFFAIQEADATVQALHYALLECRYFPAEPLLLLPVIV